MSAPNPYLLPRELIARYDTRGPRYTSYPTALEWRGLEAVEVESILEERRARRAQVPLSVYLHIPFCVRLCYYCACNRKITHSDDTVQRYLSAVYEEIDSWSRALGPGREVVQVHWGGGTPTHLSPELIQVVFGMLAQAFDIQRGAEVSVEVHPTVTTSEHLRALREVGFNRVSMGIQDFDPRVQEAVNRPQTFELTRDLIAEARRLGFTSVNTDLIYGLPLQSREGFADTLDKVERLAPDRIALFNYAHVPHIQPAQRLIREEDLPPPEVKLDLFEAAIDRFVGWGFRYIGMDHFAHPADELSVAQEERTLRRNFMGYTTCRDTDLIGIGMSSISDLDAAYLQNPKGLSAYAQAASQGRPPAERGMRLSEDDRLRRDVISRLICHCVLDYGEVEARWDVDFKETFGDALGALSPLEEDGLVELGERQLRVTPRGQILLRHVCMPFDAYLGARGSAAFSKAL